MKLILILSILTNIAMAQNIKESASYLDIEKEALRLGEKYGVENTLIVLDIDNTTLKMPQNFGSDQWFGWQSENCMKQKKSFCTTDNFGELLDIQGKIFALSNMLPTTKDTVTVIKKLQIRGFKLILLTSRGPAFRNATENVIKANDLRFNKSSFGPKGGYASTFKPYDLKDYKKYGLTKLDITKMGKKRPRSVSYMNGIYMTAGLHKGVMLKTLMNKTNTKFKAIVFADDHSKHTKGMQKIFGKENKSVELTTFRFSAVDSEVEAFKKSDKKDSINAWNNFNKMSKLIFK